MNADGQCSHITLARPTMASGLARTFSVLHDMISCVCYVRVVLANGTHAFALHRLCECPSPALNPYPQC